MGTEDDMKGLRRMVLFVSAVFLLSPLAALAHGGKLDSLGCHHDRKHGGYHCHRGKLAGRSFASKAEALKALEAKSPNPPAKQGQAKAEQTPPKADSKADTDDETRTVYVTRTGKKYHGPNCSYLSRSKIAISLKEARQKGYTPCSRCRAR